MLRGAGLFTDVAEIQRDVVNQGQRNAASRFFHAMSDKDAIAAWGREIDRILHIFTAELTLNNHTILLDIRCDVRAGQGTGGGQKPAKASTPIGESPPPRPRACFGRDGLIETIVDLADSLNPVALIGAGGIGKTSVALAILHCDRVKERFGDNRRFIRCDEFPPSRADFLRRLSKVIGARVENPEGLASLRSFLSSGEMIIVLDNAESILDPEGTEGKEIYSVVEELSQFGNICLVITSRISTIPPDCETLEVPTLAMEAAHDAFYHIYKHGGRSDAVNEILRQLDFHPLSVTLLATVAHQNKWDNGRLVREWEQRQTGVLQTRHNNSLAAAIELSLASPMFKELGPDARELLGVVAFYPQGVDENNLRWLFPTTSNIDAMFDGFCVLSLSYRSNGFVTMLAPLRDYLRPVDPTRSPFLCTTKDLYIARLSINGAIGRPGHKETEWIKSEDVNVEHLLDVFTSIDANSEVIWGTCSSFITLLYLHKPRPTMLRSKIERLPDDHTSKPDCLFGLARLFGSTGNYLEHKNLLLSALAIRRKEGNDSGAAEVLLDLSRANRTLGLRQEGIQQAKEALEIFERLGLFLQRAWCLNALAYLYVDDNQLDAAQNAATRALIWLVMGGGGELEIGRSHRLLGRIHSSKGERKRALHHFEVALGIVSSLKLYSPVFWMHHSMAELFCDEGSLDDAQAHVTQAKVHAVNDPYCLGRIVEMQARIWYGRNKYEDALAEALRAKKIYERLGVEDDLKPVRVLLRNIEQAMESRATAGKSNLSACSASASTSAGTPQETGTHQDA